MALILTAMMTLAQAEAQQDARFTVERDTNTVFEMTKLDSLAEWEPYADALRRRILVACGLYPMPERTPLNPVVEPVATHDDYIVEKVRIEAFPGFYVTGNLYRPVGDGPFPGVACPHGHWQTGRLEVSENGSVPARGITLARMGMVAFLYDMVGYNDSLQFSRDWGHAPSAFPEERKRQELWGIHPFALQLWSSVRVVDFLQSLPYVNPDNIACTGASGGGTQTFALQAVDQRVKVSAPVNMISHTMQGGCQCENAPLIRFNASNMEVGALMAPRPMLMVAATGDWTKETPEVEYPAIKGIYELYDAADNLEMVQFDAPHNYNQDSREAVYRFFGRHVLGEPEKYADYTEPPNEKEPDEALRLYPDGKLPEGAPDAEAVVASLIAERDARAKDALPENAQLMGEYQDTFRPAFAQLFWGYEPKPVDVSNVSEVEGEGWTLLRQTLHVDPSGARIPALVYQPSGDSTGRVLLVSDKGNAALVDAQSGTPGPLVASLVDAGKTVALIDVYGVGDHQGERTEGKFPETFLPTPTACRVADIVATARFLGGSPAEPVDLVGFGKAGMWCMMAAAVSDVEGRVLADADGFDTSSDDAWAETYYVPSIRSMGGIEAMAALMAPRELSLWNAGQPFNADAMRAVYGRVAAGRFTATAAPMEAEAVVAALQ